MHHHFGKAGCTVLQTAIIVHVCERARWARAHCACVPAGPAASVETSAWADLSTLSTAFFSVSVRDAGWPLLPPPHLPGTTNSRRHKGGAQQ